MDDPVQKNFEWAEALARKHGFVRDTVVEGPDGASYVVSSIGFGGDDVLVTLYRRLHPEWGEVQVIIQYIPASSRVIWQ